MTTPVSCCLALCVVLALPLAARGAGVSVVLERGGQKTPLGPADGHLLADTPLLRRVHEALQEPGLRAQLERDAAGQSVEIQLVDDRGGAADVWPHASGSTVRIGESFDTWWVTRDSLRAMLAHEVAHTRDRATMEPGAYGLDDRHQFNDVTTPRAAMIEGWANYRGARYDPLGTLLKRIAGAPPFRRREHATRAGEYRWHPLNSYEDRIANETTVTTVLRALERGLPGGGAKIERAFDATNDGSPRTLDSLLTRLARDNPRDAARIGLVLDRATGFTASEERLRAIVGPGGAAYVNRWRTPLKATRLLWNWPVLAGSDLLDAGRRAGRMLVDGAGRLLVGWARRKDPARAPGAGRGRAPAQDPADAADELPLGGPPEPPRSQGQASH